MHSAELKPLLPPALGCALVEEDRLALFEAAPVPPTKGQQTGDQDADVAGGQRHLVQAVQDLVGRTVCVNLRSRSIADPSFAMSWTAGFGILAA